MRRLFNLLAAAMIVFAVASCSKDESLSSEDFNNEEIFLSASIRNNATKTSLGEKGQSGYPVYWSDDDVIGVIQGCTMFKFNISSINEDDNSLATFKLDRTVDYDGAEFVSGEYYTAVYPYKKFKLDYISDIDYKLTCSMPASQDYVEGGFAEEVSPMMGSYDNETDAVWFGNSFSMLKLNIKGATDEKVNEIQIGSNQILAGDIIGGPQNTTTYANSLYNIKLCCPQAGVSIASSQEFVIIVPPYESMQLAVVIKTNKGSYYKTTTNSISMTTNTICNMAEIDLGDENSAQRTLMSINYPEDNIDGVLIGTKVWSNVNCGYEAQESSTYGKMYQWGRRYGQVYGDGTYTKVSSDGVSLEVGQNEGNANKFYFKGNDARDWLISSERSGILWNGGSEDNPEKTQYDPCPDGWRVPTAREMEYFTLSNSSGQVTYNGQNGYWFSGNNVYANCGDFKIFLPLSGFISSSNGSSRFRNIEGYYWSSTPYDAYSKWVQLTGSAVNHSNNNRGPASSIRCVKYSTNDPAAGAGTGGYANGGNDLEW